MHQLELLGAFPLERLSMAGRRMRREKGIALQSQAPDNHGTSGFIGSPMTVESMEKASCRAILNLFAELPDATGLHHPRNWMRGGNLQASQALGELAKRQPSKVIEVLREFKAGQHEMPAAHGIQGLSEAAGVTPQVIVDLIHRLDKAGFQSSDFRWTVTYALDRISSRAKGLPDKTCDMLESWLEPFREIPAVPETYEDKPIEPIQSTQRRKPSGQPMSILWGYGVGGFVARGNYPFLRALTYGLLCRDTPDTERWLATLEKHITRREDQKVWTSLLLDLRNLRMVPDVKRAADFARRLMKKQPSAFRSIEGLIFLAWNHRYLPAELSEHCLRIWRAADWERGDQAIGEFSLLRSQQASDDRCSSRIVNNALSTRACRARRGVRTGIAFAAVNLWREPEHRAACHRVIMRLFPLADDELSRVLMDVFRVSDPMPPDRYTVDLLDHVILEPKMLTCHSMLAHRLRHLLADGFDPFLVARVSNAILDTAGQAMGNFRSRWAGDSDDLIQIAMTLQKVEASRDAGLELFERLMELGAYEADQVLREVDRRLK